MAPGAVEEEQQFQADKEQMLAAARVMNAVLGLAKLSLPVGVTERGEWGVVWLPVPYGVHPLGLLALSLLWTHIAQPLLCHVVR